MKSQRNFSLEFKRQMVEELLSGQSSAAQLCRRHNISSSLIYHPDAIGTGESMKASPPKKRLLKTGWSN